MKTDQPNTQTDSRTTTQDYQTTQDDQSDVVKQLTSHVKAHPLRAGLFIVGVLAVLMNWVTVSIMGGGGQSIPGIERHVGQVYLLALLAIGAIDVVAPRYRKMAYTYGGAFLTLLSVGALFVIRSRINEMQAQLGLFAGAVDASVGLGVWLAILVGVGITGIGYTMDGDAR